MCGRFGLTTDLEQLADSFPCDVKSISYRPSFNIAPTSPVLTFGAQGPGSVEYMLWGATRAPQPNHRISSALFNLRWESVTTSSFLKESFQTNRCLVLTDGFFEWGPGQFRSKRAYRIGLSTWEPFGMAALWTEESGPNGPIKSCRILTRPANELIGAIHNRMPVIVTSEHQASWFRQPITDDIASLPEFNYDPVESMAMYEIDPRVGDVRADSAEIIIPSITTKALF